ncbi:hypothetical protein [Weissella tructae]|uniref:hypothetical protein n=1 Tax=Weissella tructae TaxID=887702 RepID=UPI001BDCA4BB|nr:hypothetical protein [Weissella tructae]QVV90834.1 hypothetical protein KHQ32_04155 [Weissella tructae]
MEMLLKVAGIVIAGFLITFFSFMKFIPNMVDKKLEQERGYDYDKALQVDNFYRTAGNEVLQDILVTWTRILVDFDFMQRFTENPKKLEKLLYQTVVYGSPKTIKVVSLYMQDNFNGDLNDTTDAYASFAMIVSCLKYDFTGETVDPLDLVKVKINDYKLHEEEYLKSMEKIKKRI